MYKEIDGDLIKLALEGEFDVISHGVNCFSKMGAGIAIDMKKIFRCDLFELEKYLGDINKLGQIDYETFVLGENTIWNLNDAKNNRNEPELTVVNSYTQYYYGSKFGKPIDYEALTLCMRKINATFKSKHVGLPLIGAGLAGGNWEEIKSIIIKEFKNANVTVVHYKPDKI